MKKCPSTITVLGRPYTLKVHGDLSLPNAYGVHDPDKRLIEVLDTQDDFEIISTLLHEVFHAVRRQQGRYYEGEDEEDWVNTLAHGLAIVLHQNPALLRYITSMLKNAT